MPAISPLLKALKSGWGTIASHAQWFGQGMKTASPVLETGTRAGALLSKFNVGDRIYEYTFWKNMGWYRQSF